MERESIKIDAFFRKFNLSGLNNFEELSKFKKHQKLDKRKYKKIVKKYLEVYFNEVYFLNRKFYFFLGGYIFKVRCGNWIRKTKGKEDYSIADHSIGLFWYLRPCARFWFSVSIRKQKGSSNMIPVIEKQWKKENDIQSLSLSKDFKKELKQERKLYK